MLITWLLLRGARESSTANNVMVVIKLVALALFIGVGLMNIDPANYTPFAPNGFTGIHQGAAIVFFAYIGFDAISTAAEETRNPQRNLPIGILGGLAICTVIYVVVGIVLTGMVPYQELAVADPLARALEIAGLHARRLDRGARRRGLDVGGAARVPVRAAAHLLRDGARRPAAGVGGARRSEDPHPVVTTLVTGVLVAVASLVGDAAETYDLTNIGTLFAFALVCAGVLVLRVKEPDRPRPFKVPLVWVMAPLGIAGVPLHHGRAAAPGVGAVRLAGSSSACCIYVVLRLPAQPAAAAVWHDEPRDSRQFLPSSQNLPRLGGIVPVPSPERIQLGFGLFS